MVERLAFGVLACLEFEAGADKLPQACMTAVACNWAPAAEAVARMTVAVCSSASEGEAVALACMMVAACSSIPVVEAVTRVRSFLAPSGCGRLQVRRETFQKTAVSPD